MSRLPPALLPPQGEQSSSREPRFPHCFCTVRRMVEGHGGRERKEEEKRRCLDEYTQPPKLGKTKTKQNELFFLFT